MIPFKNIAIVGLGLMGGSLGMALKRKFSGINILGVGRKEVIDEAIGNEAIDQGFLKNEIQPCVSQADLVFLCTPISHILEILPKIAEWIPPGTLVTDVGSTKNQIVEKAGKSFGQSRYFLGGHPMAGGEGRGFQYGDPLLFENAVYVLTPSQRIPVKIIEGFGQMLEKIGAKVLFLSPIFHDKVAAGISHLPQLLAVALVNLIANMEKHSKTYLKLAAGGFRDMTRIASSPYLIWEDILQTNNPEISELLESFIKELHQVQNKLKEGNLAEDFENAARYRLSIPRDTKGFLRPQYDLSVRVEDKPGVIAAIATGLAEKNINIKDIEVLKVREGDAGTLRLSFENRESRQKAQNVISKLGYRSRIQN